MSLATLTSKDWARIQKLIERKEALTEQVGNINQELASIESGDSAPSAARSARRPVSKAAAAPKQAAAPAAPAAPRKKVAAGKTGRGELKEKVVSELKAAGKGGVKVKDLASKFGTSYGNITAWFQSTAKNIPEVKKVGPAQFAWLG
jgi:hypothetical protein